MLSEGEELVLVVLIAGTIISIAVTLMLMAPYVDHSTTFILINIIVTSIVIALTVAAVVMEVAKYRAATRRRQSQEFPY